MISKLTVEQLRRCVNLANNTRDAERWTAEEWLKLYAAYKASDYDFTPDMWTKEQVEAALASPPIVPRWDEDGNPILPERRPLLCEGSGLTEARGGRPGKEGPFRWCVCYPCAELRARGAEKDAARLREIAEERKRE